MLQNNNIIVQENGKHQLAVLVRCAINWNLFYVFVCGKSRYIDCKALVCLSFASDKKNVFLHYCLGYRNTDN